VTRRASVAAPSDGTEKVPASHPVLETPAVAKAPRSASRQKPQARANLVSATVALDSFQSASEIEDWISRKSDAWLKARGK